MKSSIYLGIAFGGGIGACLRYAISTIFSSEGGFPSGTIIANLFGCFLLSFCYQLFAKYMNKHPVFKKAVTTGLIGSFTTFSAFTAEYVQLLHHTPLLALIYLMVTLFGGAGMTILGLKWGGNLVS